MKLLGPDGPHVSDLLKDVDNLDTAKRLADLASENEKSRSKFARLAIGRLLFSATAWIFIPAYLLCASMTG